MPRRLILNILFALIPFSTAACGQDQADQATPDTFFGLTKVWDIHIQFESDQWQAIQPPDDVNWNAGDAFEALIRDAMRGGHFHSKKSSRPGLAGYMGVDHQYGMATVTIGDDTIQNVGVRYKGNGTFLVGHETGKFSFKIDFNEYEEDQEYRSLTKVNLNSCVVDPSRLREALSYEVFRAAGIPASRVAWAKVFLTVAGEKEREYLGLYELVEQVDKRFLKSRYSAADGLLIKPSTFGAFRYLGEDWEPYKKAYFPKTDGTPEQQQRFIEFARLVHKAGDAEFEEQVEQFLDIDQFLNFLAVNVLLANMDSFLSGAQNYYAYLEPESNKIQLLPWDLDNSFGSLEMMGTPESRRNLSINHPQVGDDHRLIERMLSIPRYKQTYRDRIEELSNSVFEQEQMFRQIQQAGDFLRPLVALEGEAASERFDIALGDTPQFGSPHVLKHFVVERRKSIQRQLSGESDGEKLNWGVMPPGLIRLWIMIAMSIFCALLLNAAAWLWGVIAGFRANTTWGLVNMFLYPVTPMVYGFYTHKELGRRAAIMTACAAGVLLAVVGCSFAAIA